VRVEEAVTEQEVSRMRINQEQRNVQHKISDLVTDIKRKLGWLVRVIRVDSARVARQFWEGGRRRRV
jgi:hypothetical protein